MLLWMTLLKHLMLSNGLGFRKCYVFVFCTTVLVILGVHKMLPVDLFFIMINPATFNPSCLLWFVLFSLCLLNYENSVPEYWN